MTRTIASGSSTAEPQAVPLYKLADPVADWRCFRTVAARGGGVIITAFTLTLRLECQWCKCIPTAAARRDTDVAASS